ncbi:hypothetical protein TNCT_9981 [Trichonephila clavata]|uniref:Uncharacterized protein n=1 Tax=Trichonephila clavata TaxID=2740835 RepID=A0A8X6M6Y8_TRICU|nr:hypothetical protein TNCT_9981 [Trichonephila clavata]
MSCHVTPHGSYSTTNLEITDNDRKINNMQCCRFADFSPIFAAFFKRCVLFRTFFFISGLLHFLPPATMIIWFWPSELTGVISMALRLESLETPGLDEAVHKHL